MKISYKKYIKFIGITIFILVIYYKIDLRNLFLVIANINLSYLCLAILLIIFSSLFSVYKWQYILKKMDINYPFKKIYKIYFSSYLLGVLTPGKIGEIAKIFYLKKDGHKYNKPLLSMVIDRLFDAYFIIIFSSLGIIILHKQFQNIFIAISIILLFLISLLMFLLLKTDIDKYLFNLIAKIIPSKSKKVVGFLDSLIESKNQFNFLDIAIISIITILYWSINLLGIVFIAKATGFYTISIFYLLVVINFTDLIILLPISIAGIGTRDIAYLYFMTPYKINPEKIISFSILSLVAMLTKSIIGLICWIKNH